MQTLLSTYDSSMTQKGQVTIPAPIRLFMGINPGDRINFSVLGDQVNIKPSSSLASVFGSLKPIKKMSFKKMRAIALEEKLSKNVY